MPFLDDELQMILVDVLGYGELDFVANLISHRLEIQNSVGDSKNSRNNVDKRDGTLRSRLRTKKEREEDLQRKDREHKNAILLPQSSSRDAPKYPHVYKTHDAGNALSSFGKKYMLPQGSERHEHEVSNYRIHLSAFSLANHVSRNSRNTPFRLLRLAR